ncbi:heavy metal translocating P-type ATPase [Salininema proteolyticum]|uniref:Heavy metal translocating P-type ATPase n=1 Tax=Salininema proteolyticum TaxID=1607685 RepID=A0ABV8TWD3_9ACTN
MFARIWSLADVRWAALALGFFAAAGTAQLSGAPTWTHTALYALTYAAGGWAPAWEGLLALRKPRFEVDLLMVAAAVAAAAIGQWLDGALLIVIFATSGALESVLTERTERSLKALLDLTPEKASVIEDGEETAKPAKDLRAGDVITVRPGERIAGDGTVTAGQSEVDESTVTGESLPRPKSPGDPVLSGTVNGTGALTARLTRDAEDSIVARIARQVEEAAASKSRTQLTIERLEQPYSLGVVAATLLLLALPLWLGAAFEPTLLRAMTFMIVASPCALVLATMPPLLSAIALAGRKGVLVKNALTIERLAGAERAAFDKTGTLTDGRPSAAEVVVLAGSEAELREAVASAEGPSEHPLARALRELGTPRPVTDFRAEPGRGVSAVLDGERVAVGRPDAEGEDSLTGEAAEAAERLESEGLTVVAVRRGGKAIGLVGLTDSLRPDAAEAVALLRASGLEPALVSGDGDAACRRAAEEAGIADRRSRRLPGQKADDVATGNCLYVGDGVNDAPALAGAHVSAAMGSRGTALALESADMVLVRDRLTALPRMVRLARKAERTAKANLVFAGTVIAGLVAWDLVGTLPLVVGVAGHELSTVVVCLNGLRLLRSKHW